MCEWFDETCGQLLAFLEREGLAENTIVTYLSDNGWIQDPESKKFAPRSKQSPYDGGLENTDHGSLAGDDSTSDERCTSQFTRSFSDVTEGVWREGS
jgi:hypothetical protein